MRISNVRVLLLSAPIPPSRLMKKCLTDVLAEQMWSVVGATSRLGIASRVVSRI
jgi:hypothetical protein